MEIEGVPVELEDSDKVSFETHRTGNHRVGMRDQRLLVAGMRSFETPLVGMLSPHVTADPYP
jgi:hypothetical protein